ncbi:MAG TPA: holo-ACP synthase [candidate division Zixibacteria bacterium]|nr:holo-ACP synthase [candidate division Zixibacteria bacterium]
MIVGMGIDMVEVERVRRALEDPRTGERFRARVYTAGEVEYCERRRAGRFRSYAARFAVKEAVMKALGRGWGAEARWLDIEVVRAAGGRPEIALHGKTARLAERLGVVRWSVSISHTDRYGLACVAAEDAR